MSLLAILLFVGTMALSLWATMRVRQVYGKFSQLRASSGASGAETAATILRQEGIYDVQMNTMRSWEITMPRSTNGWFCRGTIFMGLHAMAFVASQFCGIIDPFAEWLIIKITYLV